MAGLVADGCTTIRHAHHLHRGYDRLIEKLRSLGANVEMHPEMPILQPRACEPGQVALAG